MRVPTTQSMSTRVMAPSRRKRKDSLTKTVRTRASVTSQASARTIFHSDRLTADSGIYIDEELSSALVAQEQELADILQEADEISRHLKTDAPEALALTNALQRAIQCAVKQSLLDKELRSLALTDDLTNLYNRRAFLALAGQQMKVARRKSQGLLFFFADVDHLKEINDLFGHREGDLALTRAAEALEQTFRNSDVIARLGGDEFAVLALEATSENKEAILRRLDKTLREMNRGETRYKLSLSVGMTRFDPKKPVSLGRLIAAADEAMYEEKKNRSKVCAT
jgi:diguanylate cyclase (GGDEF)-like protein